MSEDWLYFYFARRKDLHRQLHVWSQVCPEACFLPVCRQFDEKKSGEWVFLRTEDWRPLQKKAVLLESTMIEQGVSAPELRLRPFWSLMDWLPFQKKQSVYYVLIAKSALDDFLREAFRISVFDLSIISFRERHFLELRNAPEYLLLIGIEKYGAEVFWKDEFQSFFPYRKIHPLSFLWANDEKIRLISKKTLIVLSELEFNSVLPNVQWVIPDTEKVLKPVGEPYKVTVRLCLAEDKRYQKPLSTLWFYELTQAQLLENWITDLPRAERMKFRLLYTASPMPGFFLRTASEKEGQTVFPPASAKAFYTLYPGQNYYLPSGLRLQPALPLTEMQSIFPLHYTHQLMLFFPEDDHNTRVFLDDTEFENLDSIVHFVLTKNELEVKKLMERFAFVDPDLVVDKEEKSKDFVFAIKQDKEVDIDFVDEAVPFGKTMFEDKGLTVQEREDYLAEIQQLRFLILENPNLENFNNWQVLGQLEGSLGNFSEALCCLEMAFSLGFSEHSTSEAAACIYESWKNLRGFDESFEKTNLEKLFKTASSDELKSPDIELGGLYFMTSHNGLSPEQKAWYHKIFLPAFLSEFEQLPLLRLWNIANSLYHYLTKDTYSLLAMKDRVLSGLYNQGVWGSGEIPAFIANHSFGVSSGETPLDDWFVRFEEFFSRDDERVVLGNRLLFQLIFAGGYARCRLSERVSRGFFEAGNIIRHTRNRIHEILHEYYDEKCRNILRDQIELEPQLWLKSLGELEPLEQYQVRRLTDLVQIGQEFIQYSGEIEEFIGLRQRNNTELRKLIPDILSELSTDKRLSIDRLSDRKKRAYCTIISLLPQLGEEFCFKIMDEIKLSLNTLNKTTQRAAVMGKMLEVARFYDNSQWLSLMIGEFMVLIHGVATEDAAVFTDLLGTFVDEGGKIKPDGQVLELIRQRLLEMPPSFVLAKARILLGLLQDRDHNTEQAIYQLRLAADFYLKNQGDDGDGNSRFELLLYGFYRLKNATLELRRVWNELLLQNFARVTDHFSVSRSYFNLSKALFMEFVVQTESRRSELSPEMLRYLQEVDFVWKASFFRKLRRLESLS